MRWMWLMLAVAACSSPSTDPAPAPATTPATPTPATTPSPPAPPAPAAPAAAETGAEPRSARPVDPGRARAVAAELRELRGLVHDHRLTEAAPRFVALARREPGNPRLHCEAGFVAQQAGNLEDADTELAAGLAIYERMGTVPDALRVPYAMCLYNRGLLAEADGDGWLAADCYRRSLALRPNRTVEAHLRTAEAMPEGDVPDETSDEGEVTRRVPVNAGGRVATIVRTDFADEEGSAEAGCFQEQIELADPVAGVATFDLVGACEDTFSIFADWANTSDPVLVDGGPTYGPIVTVRVSHGGRGDDNDGRGIYEGSTETLHLFAVVQGHWAQASVVIGESSSADCGNDPCDDPETTDDDDENLRAEFEDSFTLRWSIANGALVLEELYRTGGAELPPLGATPLAELLPGP